MSFDDVGKFSEVREHTIEEMESLIIDEAELDRPLSEEDMTALTERKPATLLITGQAGCGKSFYCMARQAEDPKWAFFTSTTGISAINIGAVTLNSALGYFDEMSLRDIYLSGRLQMKLRELAEQGYRNLLIEEVSMLTAPALDMLWRALVELAHSPSIKEPLGLVLVGDFAQLPPVKGEWAFAASCWSEFDNPDSVMRLTKMWRQSDPQFLMALNAARSGDGKEASRLLTEAGVTWHTGREVDFDGTTILPKNDEVDRHNLLELDRVKGAKFRVGARRWGKDRSEWKNVPEQTELKVGAYVMILANQRDPASGEFDYVNGDCGHVVEWDSVAQVAEVKLVRTGEPVRVGKVVRSVEFKDLPAGVKKEAIPKGVSGYVSQVHKNARGKHVTGQIEYLPLRLAYASTVHKSQGLSLDKVQIDFRGAFFGAPGMLYVALSRCRTLAGLKLVGMREVFEKRCNADGKIRRWL